MGGESREVDGHAPEPDLSKVARGVADRRGAWGPTLRSRLVVGRALRRPVGVDLEELQDQCLERHREQ